MRLLPGLAKGPVQGIVMGTVFMLALAVPRTFTNWEDLTSGVYSSLWFIWPMIGFGLVVMALAAWKTWGPRGNKVTVVVEEVPEEWLHSDREGR